MASPRRNTLRSPGAAFRLSVLLIFFPLVLSGAYAQPKGRTRSVTYQNVSLAFDAGLAKDFVAETIPAVPLEEKTDKPDGVAPAHVLITLRDSYAAKLKRDTESIYALPQIAVFPTRDPGDPRFDEEYPTMRGAVNDLSKLLSRRAGSVSEAIPFLPWADEHQLFIVKKRLVRFRNGRGVLFLTQYEQEESPVSNASLVYTFQGLTDDNAWYVSAVFPVAAQGLTPPPGEAGSAAFHAGYDAYIKRTTENLNRLPARRFTPHLLLLEEMIRSIKVGPR
ncbi:MAG TPA: hypothetical protein VMF59_02515 [Bacteroidota bacterium]|nr:hypothetical protein [Bacteroidota bacterium]